MKIVLDIIVVILACVAGLLIAAGTSRVHDDDKVETGPLSWSLGLAAALILVVVGIMGVNSFGLITAGDVGVTTQWGKPTGELKQNGWYFAPAFLGFSVYPMQSTTIRQYPVSGASASTNDLQTTETDITFNFHLNQDPKSLLNVYTNLRDSFDGVIRPITLEALKSVTAHYTAENLIKQRSRAKADLDTLLRARLEPYGIVIDNVSLTDFRFSDEFNSAVEAKVTQEQQALQAKAKLSQVYYEAQQTVTQARADATALSLKRQNITPTLVQQAFVDKWDGKLPAVMGGGSLMNLPQSLLTASQ